MATVLPAFVYRPVYEPRTSRFSYTGAYTRRLVAAGCSKHGSFAVVVAAGALVLSVALGVRQTFGLFIGPIAADHFVSVGLLSFAIALQNLIWGLAQPFAGALTDRFGPAPVVAPERWLYGAGLLPSSTGPTRSRSCWASGARRHRARAR